MDYVTNTDEQLQEMLGAIGVGSFEQLLADIPRPLRAAPLQLPSGLSEAEVVAHFQQLAFKNRSLDQLCSYLGAGMYDHFIPSSVDALAARGEFATAYTPYQAEASQGTLQAIYEYQTMICELTGLDVANASLYDGASALAEAGLLTTRVTHRPRILISAAVHPEYRQVLRTYAQGSSAIVEDIPAPDGITDPGALAQSLRDDVAGVVLQSPNFFGAIEPLAELSASAHQHGALVVAATYPIALGLIAPPGACGADIAVGEAQCLGNPISFGGPTLGFFATTQQLVRKMPGRIAGCTTDVQGRRGFVLTLQAREQHIRREKATSNICTNQGLLALRATIYLSLLGPQGLGELAELNARRAHALAQRWSRLAGWSLRFRQPFFNEFAVQWRGQRSLADVQHHLLTHGILGGVTLGRWYPDLQDTLLVCVTETKRPEDLDQTMQALELFKS